MYDTHFIFTDRHQIAGLLLLQTGESLAPLMDAFLVGVGIKFELFLFEACVVFQLVGLLFEMSGAQHHLIDIHTQAGLARSIGFSLLIGADGEQASDMGLNDCLSFAASFAGVDR